jgi:hypothetical protein
MVYPVYNQGPKVEYHKIVNQTLTKEKFILITYCRLAGTEENMHPNAINASTIYLFTIPSIPDLLKLGCIHFIGSDGSRFIWLWVVWFLISDHVKPLVCCKVGKSIVKSTFEPESISPCYRTKYSKCQKKSEQIWRVYVNVICVHDKFHGNLIFLRHV